jgi:response regulator of citrate/malate metabolism
VAGLHRDFVEQCKGFEVAGVALTARQAIDMNRELAPDLILLDLYLPDEHGLDIVETLRAYSGADVIVITAARDVPNIRTAMQRGALFYLVKPFRFAAFRDRLDAYARLRTTLANSPELSQANIDDAFGTLRTPAVDLPKGLSAQTLHAIERTLQEARSICTLCVDTAIETDSVTSRSYLRLREAHITRALPYSSGLTSPHQNRRFRAA